MAGIIAHVPGAGKPRYMPVRLEDFTSGPLEGVFATALGVIVAACGDLFGAAGDDDGAASDAEEAPPTDASPTDACRLVYGGRDLTSVKAAEAFLRTLRKGMPCVVHVAFRLLGGKGGFGALLRGQRGLGKKTTNFDAMRDLSGRRIRHAKAVDRIKEWMEQNKREDDLVSLITGEGPELPKPAAAAEKLDATYVQRLKRGATEKATAVGEGIRLQQVQGAGQAGAGAATVAQPPKRVRLSEDHGSVAVADFLNPLGALSPPSTPTDDEEAAEAEDHRASASASSSGAVPAGSGSAASSGDAPMAPAGLGAAPAGSGSAASSGDAPMALAGLGAAASSGTAAAGTGPASPSDTAPVDSQGPGDQEPAEATAAASQAAAGAASAQAGAASAQEARGGRRKRGGQPAAAADLDGEVVHPGDLAAFATADELAAKVSPDVLKRSLQKLGLKCGGLPRDRAGRLFLLKEQSLEELPKSAFAK